MTVEQAATYLAFALSVGAVYKAFFGPQLDIVRLQEQVKALQKRLNRLDKIESEDE